MHTFYSGWIKPLAFALPLMLAGAAAHAQQVFQESVTISNSSVYGKSELLIHANNGLGNWNSYWAGDHDKTARILIRDAAFPNGLYIGTDQHQGSPTASYQIGTKDNLPIAFRTSGVELMRLLPNGNVAVGTPNADAKLSILGGEGTGAKPALELRGGGAAYAWGLLSLKSQADATLDYMIGRGGAGYSEGRALTLHVPDLNFYGNSGTAPKISFVSSGANTLGYVESGSGNWFLKGNVGIGTTAPDAKLTVAGRVHAREVKVTVSAGADFVFEPAYQLPSLEETERYVRQHRHLPGIAPAKEMEENGVDLGQLNIQLLQKVEELTLLLIEQDKQVKELRKEVYRLKSQAKSK